MSWVLSAADIESLATGAWILGTGGGGSPYLARLNLERAYDRGIRCEVVEPGALSDDAAVAVVSTMGAPLVGQERLLDPVHLARAVRLMESHTGIEFAAVMAVEIGGSNAFAPFLVSAELGLPVVDADAMGRAYPEAQMTSFAIGELRPWPLALVDCRDNEVVVTTTESWKWMERLSRAVCTEMGSVAATCKAPRTGREVRDWGIGGTVTQAVRLGRAVRDARRAHLDPVEAVVADQGGRHLFVGKVHDVDRQTTGGFLRGTATLDGLDRDAGTRFELGFQNEWAVGWRDGDAVVTTPDLICVLDSVSGEAVGTETIRYGQRVSVVALPAPAVLRTPKGLEHVGPRAFGYDLDHRSVFGVEAGLL